MSSSEHQRLIDDHLIEQIEGVFCLASQPDCTEPLIDPAIRTLANRAFGRAIRPRANITPELAKAAQRALYPWILTDYTKEVDPISFTNPELAYEEWVSVLDSL